MFGIARNLLRRHWRRRRRNTLVEKPGVLAALADLLESRSPPERSAVDEESAQQLMLAVTSLDADAQVLIFGFYFEGRSAAQLALQYGGTEKSVELRLYRARSRLRERLRSGKDDERV
jgi:RNA polymerase sigma factor (sigma-70 family)